MDMLTNELNTLAYKREILKKLLAFRPKKKNSCKLGSVSHKENQ